MGKAQAVGNATNMEEKHQAQAGSYIGSYTNLLKLGQRVLSNATGVGQGAALY